MSSSPGYAVKKAMIYENDKNLKIVIRLFKLRIKLKYVYGWGWGLYLASDLEKLAVC